MIRSVLRFALLLLTPVCIASSTVLGATATQPIPATGTAQPPRIAIEHAPAPLFDDPIWHGASDPAIVWLPGKGDGGEYWIYYTQRRATLPNPHGVDWVHGTAIGIATSRDGLHWSYAGVAQGSAMVDGVPRSLENPVADNVTWWAPTVFWEKGNGIAGGGAAGDRLHMFVTLVHGIFSNWTGDRTIEHFTSDDGVHWTYVSSLPLASRRVIDPTVYRIGDAWYLWYKNEAAGSHTFVAKSTDLTTWHDQGEAIHAAHHEAPFVWHWKGVFWDLQDNGRALDAWRSDKGTSDWTANAILLDRDSNGRRPFDRGTGHHPWVIVQPPATGATTPDAGQLLLFYFTHDAKKSYIQLAEITLGRDGKLACDRDGYAAPTGGKN